MINHSVNFFDRQFQTQVSKEDFSLNPFEQLALPFLQGRILDLGCGLGNLSIEAARRGCSVVAVDGSETGIEHIRSVAARENLAIKAELADLARYQISESYDVIVSIGLLMFMHKIQAYEILTNIKLQVRAGGYAIINVLVDTTTYLDMFDLNHYYLFGDNELQAQFADWEVVKSNYDRFVAPGESIKIFTTLVARKH